MKAEVWRLIVAREVDEDRSPTEPMDMLEHLGYEVVCFDMATVDQSATSLQAVVFSELQQESPRDAGAFVDQAIATAQPLQNRIRDLEHVVRMMLDGSHGLRGRDTEQLYAAARALFP